MQRPKLLSQRRFVLGTLFILNLPSGGSLELRGRRWWEIVFSSRALRAAVFIKRPTAQWRHNSPSNFAKLNIVKSFLLDPKILSFIYRSFFVPLSFAARCFCSASSDSSSLFLFLRCWRWSPSLLSSSEEYSSCLSRLGLSFRLIKKKNCYIIANTLIV